MSRKSKQDFLVFLRQLSKKGFYDVLVHVKDNPDVHYNEVLKHSLEKRVVGGRASITIILNGLTDMGLLDRVISQDRPIRTTYNITEKGNKVLKHFKELMSLF